MLYGLDTVIGVSSTSVCISAVIGLSTYVLLPLSLKGSKWSCIPSHLQSNTTLLHVENDDDATHTIQQLFSLCT